jgi:hypothetical protein
MVQDRERQNRREERDERALDAGKCSAPNVRDLALG